MSIQVLQSLGYVSCMPTKSPINVVRYVIYKLLIFFYTSFRTAFKRALTVIAHIQG